MNCEDHLYWGTELIFNCKAGDKEAVTSRETIKAFIDELVEKIKMEKHGETTIEHFGEGAAAGLTAVQLITTSSIVIHFCDESGSFYGNLFSCKHFLEADVMRIVVKYFKPEQTQTMVLRRGV